MQRNFYAPKLPNQDAAEIWCFTVFVEGYWNCNWNYCATELETEPVFKFETEVSLVDRE